jgi:hypothetical protein
MAEPILIKFLTGAALGFDEPSICHSGKPKRNRCYAVTQAPGRDRWTFVQNPSFERRRDGWWCPDCAHQLRQALEQRGSKVTVQDIPLPAPGRA